MLGIEEKQVLADLIEIIKSLNLPMILVGAGARLIIFDRRFGEGRGTKDWDIAVSIDNWATYQNLSDALTKSNSPRFQKTKTSYNFIHKLLRI